MDPDAQRAIQAALDGRWKEAVEVNKEILATNPKDQEALNRLARACLELGKVKRALASYKKVLKIDKYNAIAQKAIERLEKASQDGNSLATNHESNHHPVNSSDFIEEPGKTKTASLIHLGSSAIIASLDVGDKVKLTPHAHRVSVCSESGKFIGRLPDDLSRRLIKLVRAGNEYDTVVRSISLDAVRIFIKELKRAPQVKDIQSFPIFEKNNYVSFTPPDLEP